jgi:hypothetical protein
VRVKLKLSDSSARWSLPGAPVRPSSASRSRSASPPPLSSPASSVPSLALAVRVRTSSSFHQQQQQQQPEPSSRSSRPPSVVRAPNRFVVDRTGNNRRVIQMGRRTNLNRGKRATKLDRNIAPRGRRPGRRPFARVGHRSRVVVVVVRSNIVAACGGWPRKLDVKFQGLKSSAQFCVV